MRQPNEYEALKTPGPEPVESKTQPNEPELKLKSGAPSADEHLTIEDRMRTEASAFQEVQKQKLAEGKINGPEFRERLDKFEADQRRKLESGGYDDKNISDTPASENITQKHLEPGKERGDRATASRHGTEKDSFAGEHEGSRGGEISERKAERIAKIRERGSRFEFDEAAQQVTRQHDGGSRTR